MYQCNTHASHKHQKHTQSIHSHERDTNGVDETASSKTYGVSEKTRDGRQTVHQAAGIHLHTITDNNEEMQTEKQ